MCTLAIGGKIGLTFIYKFIMFYQPPPANPDSDSFIENRFFQSPVFIGIQASTKIENKKYSHFCGRVDELSYHVSN